MAALMVSITAVFGAISCVMAIPESSDGLIHFASRPQNTENQFDKLACIQDNCAYITSKADFWGCVQENCATSEIDKRWIDSTHYPERRRSQVDAVDLCIRRLCHGLNGNDLKECIMVCRPSKALFAAERKRWVDPILYKVDK